MAESTDGWLTKQEAAKVLGVSTKTLEKYVQQGKLAQQMQAQINKPARAVIDPATVERMISDRSSLVRQEQGGNPSQMPSALPPPEFWAALVEAIKPKQLPPAEPPLSELRQLLIVTRAEAKRLGYTAAILRQVPALPGKRYRMRDLEAL